MDTKYEFIGMTYLRIIEGGTTTPIVIFVKIWYTTIIGCKDWLPLCNYYD